MTRLTKNYKSYELVEICKHEMTLKWWNCEEDVSWDTNIAWDKENQHSENYLIKLLEVIVNVNSCDVLGGRGVY